MTRRHLALLLIGFIAGIASVNSYPMTTALFQPGDLWAGTYEIENDPDQIDEQVARIATAVQRNAMANRHERLVLSCVLNTADRPVKPSRITWPRAD